MRSLLRIGSSALVAALVGYHVSLLWARLASGTLLEPIAAARWLAALALLTLLVGLRRRGASLVRGRPALVLWVLVLLLHAVALAPGVEVAPKAAATAELFLVLPVGLFSATVLASVAATLAQGATPIGFPVLIGRFVDEFARHPHDLGASSAEPRAPPA
jgi:hypothetical protein